MRRLTLAFAALLACAAPAAAQQNWSYGTQMRPSRPDTGSSSSRAGSYTNPYVVTNPQGQRLGTMYESRPAQPNAPGGSYTNPYVYRPQPR